MAGTESHQNPDKTLNPIKRHWEIQYARFFSFPSLPYLSLFPPPRSFKITSGGAWLSWSSTAFLGLINDQKPQQVLLIASFLGNIKWEEHYVTKLHFFWPQVSCLADSLTRDGRVVFASYRDSVGQVQKFAMRFSASEDAQSFINSLKENLKVVRNVGPPHSNFGAEIYSPSEFELLKEMRNFGVPHRDLGSETSSPSKFISSDGSHNRNATCATLPPSFTALPPDCLTKAAQEAPKVAEEVDLMSQMARNMTTSSFQDMLSTIESVIYELGGDMALNF